MAEQKFKHIVRVVNTDLDGNKQIAQSLRKIKGINFMFANFVCNVSGVDKQKKTGTLTDAEIQKLEQVIKAPSENSGPVWMLNRRKDYLTGEDKHIHTSDLEFAKTSDVRRLQKIKSYRGLRLAWGLTVRGQRTRSNFRRHKSKGLGVKKKSK